MAIFTTTQTHVLLGCVLLMGLVAQVSSSLTYEPDTLHSLLVRLRGWL
jgi:hypothetical protein